MLITNINEDQSLLTRLEHLVAASDELRVLVGLPAAPGIEHKSTFFHFDHVALKRFRRKNDS